MKPTSLKDVSKKRPPLTDIPTLRKRAREHIESGAVTSGYAADREAVTKMLNEALATELVCVLRYKRHYFMAAGVHAPAAAAEFLEHANEEMEHADLLAKRIVELRGEPNFSPDGLAARSHAEYAEGANLREMIKEDLIAERIAIESYREMVEYLGEQDPTTRRLLEKILAVEEEHADDLASLLAGLTA
ncbi:MAG: ferritin-like domain-containing protein [Burkholderiales bacterium]